MNCRGKECNTDEYYSDCHDLSEEMWNNVNSYRFKLAVQRESKVKAYSLLSLDSHHQCLFHYLNFLAQLIMQLLLLYLDDWLVSTESVPPLLQHREQLLQLCWDLGIVISWEKSDLESSSRGQYLRMLIDTIQDGSSGRTLRLSKSILVD